MSLKCPGSTSFSQPHPESMDCPFCGTDLEIWSDEVKAKCPKCKRVVMRQGQQTCLDWCKYAKECVGDTLYQKYLKNKEAFKKKQPEHKPRSALYGKRN